MPGLKILFLVASEHDLRIVKELLVQDQIEHELIPCENQEDFTAAIKNEAFDIILADFSLSEAEGLKALDLARQFLSDVPFIIISGVMGEELAIEALKRGATDYVLKQRPERLIPSIKRALLEKQEKYHRLHAESRQQKYDFIVNASKSMFSLVDSSFTYEAVNDAFCRAHQLMREEIIGKTLIEIWGKDTFEQYIRPNFDKSFGDNIVRYQTWFEIPSQGMRCFEVTFYPYKEAGSDVTHTVVDTMDITEKQLAQEALQESEERYRTLFDHATEAIFLQRDGKIRTCNARAVECFGFSSKDIMNGEVFRFSPATQPDGIPSGEKAAKYIRAAENGEPVEFQWAFERKDRSRFLAEVSLTSFQLRGEVFFQFFIHDITERAKTEKSYRRLAHAMDQSAELVTITGVDGNILYANRAYTDQLGFEIPSLIGQSYKKTMPPEITDAYLNALRTEILQQKVWSGELDIVTRDGEKRRAMARISPVLNAAGEVTEYISVLRDITEEARMKEYLRQVQKMETIGTLAGGIAHDFNNIIATILGHTDMALQDLDNGHQAYEDLEQIRKASQRARGLVNQILTFSRQVDFKPEVVNIASLTLEAIRLLDTSVPLNIQVETDLTDSCSGVMADPSQMHQVIMNICTNAIYAMKDTGGTLSIQSQCVTPDRELRARIPTLQSDRYIQLEFRDTGVGMEDEVRDRIFEPFFTTKATGEGTGLGLSVVHGIVKNLSGEILVKSEPGKGSSFTLLLPCITD